MMEALSTVDVNKKDSKAQIDSQKHIKKVIS